MIDVALVILVVGCALTTVMTARLLRSAVMLAVTSAALAVIMFRLSSPLAAVFELSVCAGLIPAIFISAVGLTRRLDPEGLLARKKDRLKRFWYLPLIIIIIAAALSQVPMTAEFMSEKPLTAVETPSNAVVLEPKAVVLEPKAVAEPADASDPRTVFWHQRHLDLLGQVVILLGGAFAVVILLKERKGE
jgi:NADH-quinone oxidoreductase subunit J